MIVNYCILRAHTREKPDRRTSIRTSFKWLAKMGFVAGALVCAVPHQDGFSIELQNEKNVGLGKTIRVGIENRVPKPVLTVQLTKNFSIPELSGGDFLVATYEYGRIIAKKLPPADKYYVVSWQNYGAYLRLNGGWMDDAGFPPETIVTAAPSGNCITFDAWNGKVDEYPALVKFARKNKLQVLQTRTCLQNITFINLYKELLDKAGFADGDVAGIRCGRGQITMFKPDLTMFNNA